MGGFSPYLNASYNQGGFILLIRMNLLSNPAVCATRESGRNAFPANICILSVSGGIGKCGQKRMYISLKGVGKGGWGKSKVSFENHRNQPKSVIVTFFLVRNIYPYNYKLWRLNHFEQEKYLTGSFVNY